jgi:uncharacterized protein YkwD
VLVFGFSGIKTNKLELFCTEMTLYSPQPDSVYNFEGSLCRKAFCKYSSFINFHQDLELFMDKNKHFILQIGLAFSLVLTFLAGGILPVFAQEPQPPELPTLQAPLQIPDAQISENFEALDLVGPYFVYLPGVARSENSLYLNINNRQTVKDYYLSAYQNAAIPAPGWTGSQSSCSVGSTSQAFRDAVLARINFFRRMAGVPDTVVFSTVSNQKAQAAALIMSAEGALSHSPPTNWACYSTLGKDGAGSSNLALGNYGWGAINAYMRDYGSGNTAAGHRRWILYPQTREMGTGDVPGGDGNWSSNSLVVFDTYYGTTRPATREAFVSWPPPGYAPYSLVFARWSFSYARADFSTATVSMISNGAALPVVQHPIANGYGENTIVWIPNNMGDSASWPKPAGDTTYTITIRNVKINGQPQNFTYNVIIFDPAK